MIAIQKRCPKRDAAHESQRSFLCVNFRKFSSDQARHTPVFPVFRRIEHRHLHQSFGKYADDLQHLKCFSYTLYEVHIFTRIGESDGKMKIIADEKEIKEYFAGLRNLLWGGGTKPAPSKPECPTEGPELRSVLLRHLNQEVEIGTEAGSVAGVLRQVGRDYAEIREAGGTAVIIRFAQIISIQGL